MADDRIEIEIVLDDGSIQKGFAKFNKTADQSAKKAGKSLTSSFTGAFARLRRSALSSLAGIGAAFAGVAGIRAATQNLIEFQQRFEEIKTIIPNVAQANDELNASLIKSAQIFGTSAADQARTFYQIISAGITDASEANKVLIASNKLAIGGLATQAEAVNILTSAINSFGAQNLSAARASDILFAAVRVGKTRVDLLAASLGQILPAAKAIGVTFEDTAAAIATLTTRGLSTSEAVTQLNAVFTALLRKQALAKTFGPTVAKAFSLASLKAKGLTDFLQDLNKAVGGSGEALVKLLGRVEGVRAILTLSGDNFVALRRNVDSLNNSFGDADRAFQTINLTLGQQIKVLSATFSGEILKMSQSIEGPLISSVMGLTDAINFLSTNSRSISGVIREVTVTFAAFMIGIRLGPSLFASFSAGMVGVVMNFRVIPIAIKLAGISLRTFATNLSTLKISFQTFPFATLRFGFKRLVTAINFTKIAVIGLKTAVNILKAAVTLGLIFAIEFLITKFLEIKDELGGVSNLFSLLGLSIKKSFAQAVLSVSEFFLKLQKVPVIGKLISKVFGDSFNNMRIAAEISIDSTNQALDKLFNKILDARDEIRKPFESPKAPPGLSPEELKAAALQTNIDNLKKSIFRLRADAIATLLPLFSDPQTVFGHKSIFETLEEKGVEALNNLKKELIAFTNKSVQQIQQLNEAVRNGFARAMSSSIQAFVSALANGENALEAFGKAFIGTIGDLAIQLGTMIIASGIALLNLFEGNPAGAIAFGAGLVAIGSLLKALSGSGFSGGGVPSGNDAVTSPILDNDFSDDLRGQGPNVQVTIMGDIFDSDATGLRIAEILREQGINNAVIN